jgi:type I restriction enzyme S subunit
MREMKESGVTWVGKIPAAWEMKTIKQLMIERVEKNKELEVNTILSLSAKDGVTLYNSENHSGNKPREDLSDYKIVRENDIVVNSMNILSGSVGLSAYTGVVSPVYYIYYPRDDGNVEYFHYIFQCFEFQRSLRGLGNGILIKETESGGLNTIRMRIPSQKLGAQEFPYCSRKEQDRIVAALEASAKKVDALIANQEAQIVKLKAYKQSLITEVVTKGLNSNVPMKSSGVEAIGSIPQHWKIYRTKFVADAIFKGNGITKDEVVEDGDIQCIRYGEIYSKYDGSFEKTYSRTNESAITSPQYISSGDILFAGTGELVEEIGKNVVYTGKEPCLAGGDIIVLKHSQNPIFLNYALYCTSSQTQKSKGKAKLKVVHISASEIGNVIIALPPLDEQNAIAEYLDKKCEHISRLIEIKKKKIESLTQYKKSLIYEYVTGKKEVM